MSDLLRGHCSKQGAARSVESHVFCAVPGHDIVSCRVLTSPTRRKKDTSKAGTINTYLDHAPGSFIIDLITHQKEPQQNPVLIFEAPYTKPNTARDQVVSGLRRSLCAVHSGLEG